MFGFLFEVFFVVVVVVVDFVFVDFECLFDDFVE